MFGKKKEEKDIEKTNEETNLPNEENEQQETQVNDSTEEFLNEISPDEQDDSYESEPDKFDSVKSKISKILKSSNIEIIDENEGDEYEFANDQDKEKQQHDYDELKAIFGSGNKEKKQELTLTIDDFDYTYTGEYLDEFDLVHIKNIKKIKLQHKHSKLIKRIVIAASVLIVVGVAVTLSILLTRKTPVYLKSVSLSKTEQSYLLNESFDYTGIYILAEYSDGRVERIKLDSSHFYDSTGYVERPGNDLVFTGGEEATLVFSYSDFQTSMKIKILSKEIENLSAKASKGLSTLSFGDYITEKDLIIFAKYLVYHETNVIRESNEIIRLSNDVTIRVGGEGTVLNYVPEKNGYEVTTSLAGKYLIISYEGLSFTLYC